MGYMVAFCWSKECEAELKEAGFEKREVYMKSAPPGMTRVSNEIGDGQFFKMKHPPYQFVTTSYWGAGND